MPSETAYGVLVEHENEPPDTQEVADAVANIPHLEGDVHVSSGVVVSFEVSAPLEAILDEEVRYE